MGDNLRPSTASSWTSPNYTNPVTRGDAIIVLNTVLIAICIVITGLRIYSRIFIKKWFGLDDALICISLVSIGFEL